MLGTWIDCGLSMNPGVEKILSKSRPKIRSLVRAKNMYSVKVMLNQFKTHLWTVIEYHNGTLIMAAASEVSRLDSMQRGFLQELSLGDEEAFVTYNFAPLSLRRRIGMLGFLHKRVLQQCHPAFLALLPMVNPATPRAPWLHLEGLRIAHEHSERALVYVF